ncbi:MAG: hypothetical protein ACREE9_16110 [Stellaceae bacterium]
MATNLLPPRPLLTIFQRLQTSLLIDGAVNPLIMKGGHMKGGHMKGGHTTTEHMKNARERPLANGAAA